MAIAARFLFFWLPRGGAAAFSAPARPPDSGMRFSKRFSKRFG